ncbi:hypothetical protein A3L22_29845 [Streptomyces griseus subsp. griseus]|nr:hypothetical protein A3L22_29845 [Streptomyces griseus subsp. griseus]
MQVCWMASAPVVRGGEDADAQTAVDGADPVAGAGRFEAVFLAGGTGAGAGASRAPGLVEALSTVRHPTPWAGWSQWIR